MLPVCKDEFCKFSTDVEKSVENVYKIIDNHQKIHIMKIGVLNHRLQVLGTIYNLLHLDAELILNLSNTLND